MNGIDEGIRGGSLESCLTLEIYANAIKELAIISSSIVFESSILSIIAVLNFKININEMMTLVF